MACMYRSSDRVAVEAFRIDQLLRGLMPPVSLITFKWQIQDKKIQLTLTIALSSFTVTCRARSTALATCCWCCRRVRDRTRRREINCKLASHQSSFLAITHLLGKIRQNLANYGIVALGNFSLSKETNWEIKREKPLMEIERWIVQKKKQAGQLSNWHSDNYQISNGSRSVRGGEGGGFDKWGASRCLSAGACLP